MRKLFSLFMALLATTSLWAYEFQSGNLYYNITSDSTVEVTNQKEWSSSNYSGLTTATIPETVTYNGSIYNVTSIGEYAFCGCSSLTSVTIPNSVTSIGNYAFYYCSSLTSVTIPNSVTNIGYYAFSDCSSLTSIVVETGNTTYDSRDNCNAIIETATNTLVIGCKNTIIPNSVTSIGDNAFEFCSSLTSVTIPNSITSIGNSAFSGCSSLTSVTIPNSITSIGNSAFSGCSSLTSVTIPNSVTSIGYSAFRDCSKLTSITIPNSVTSIGYAAFYGCSSLTSVTIPDSVTSIGYSAFRDCSSLTSVTIPNSVTSIGESAFFGCSSLTYVTCEATTPPTLGSSVFPSQLKTAFIPNGTKSAYEASDWASYITLFIEGGCIDPTWQILYTSSDGNVVTPNKTDVFGANFVRNTYQDGQGIIFFDGPVTQVGGSAFSGCSSLTSITIPNSVTSIGGSAFDDCSSLTSVTIGNGVTSIGDYTFRRCSSLTTITIPNSVTEVGGGVFCYCSHLESIVLSENITSLPSCQWMGPFGFFEGCKSLTSITIPNSITSIGADAFQGCSSLASITIPNSVTEVGGGIFYGCSHLESIVLSENITSLPSCNSDGCLRGFFEGCKSLISVTIPNSVTSIGKWAFSDCSSLTSIIVGADNKTYDSRENCNAIIETASNTLIAGCQKTIIPNSVTSIGYYAFRNCTSLTSVTIGESVTSIGDEAFRGCTSLASITIPNSVTSIGYEAFFGCSSLTSVTIGESVTSIGDYAFLGCSALDSIVWNAKNCADVSAIKDAPFYGITSQIKSFTFGENVEHIPAYLCYGMDKLPSVTTPNSLKTIGTSAFEGCARLGKINLGTDLEEIAANAFAGCTRLYDIYVYATYPPFADESSFANYNVYVYIPCEYQRDYILDVVWGKFKFIECIDSEEVTTDDVVVTPGTNDVTITWPTEGNADTYTIIIKKGNEVFCTLTFNADGQLLNIAFAPGRDGNHPAQYAEQAGNGYRFTVTSLESGTKYAYNIEVKDAANKTIKSHSGEFTTQSTTAVDNVTTNNANIQKIMRDGQFIIVRDGVEYNVVGQEL